MSNNVKTGDNQSGYLFSVEILIHADSCGKALEKLVRTLNVDDVVDYRVVKGITLGEIIESALKRLPGKTAEISIGRTKDELKGNSPEIKPVQPAAPAIGESFEHRPIVEQIEKYKNDRTLVRLTVVKGKGVKLSVPCRILNYDWLTDHITVYHVDEKKVYTYQLYEIDDLTAG